MVQIGVPAPQTKAGAAKAIQGPAGAATKRVYWTRKRILDKIVYPWLFILPILTLHGIVVVIPAIQGLFYSFTDWSGIGKAKFIGMGNFVRMFTVDPAFRDALGRNFQWMAFFLTVPFALALFASSLLAGVKRGGMFYRVVLFMPYILPSIITATIWRYLYNPRFGIGHTLNGFGIDWLNFPILGRGETALLGIAFADNWHFWGFLMVLFLTAMQSISTELYDAARVDGANRWQEFRHVTLPGIRPVVLFMMMMVMIWSFLVFDYVWILTQGGPAGSTELLGVVIFKNAFLRFDAGYAAAQGITITIFAGLILSFGLLVRKLGWNE